MALKAVPLHDITYDECLIYRHTFSRQSGPSSMISLGRKLHALHLGILVDMGVWVDMTLIPRNGV